MSQALRKRKRARRKMDKWRVRHLIAWGTRLGLMEPVLIVGWR